VKVMVMVKHEERRCDTKNLRQKIFSSFWRENGSFLCS